VATTAGAGAKLMAENKIDAIFMKAGHPRCVILPVQMGNGSESTVLPLVFLKRRTFYIALHCEEGRARSKQAMHKVYTMGRRMEVMNFFGKVLADTGQSVSDGHGR